MADDRGAQAHPTARPRAEFNMGFVPHLPGARAIVPAEQAGKFVFLVAMGAMTQQCLDEMVNHLRAIVGGGRWTQNWGSPPPALTREHATAPELAAVFDMEFRPELPDGAAIMPDERPGRFVWLVRTGAMTQQCFDELRTYLLAIVGSGQWVQSWGAARPRTGVR
ncbi:hypothetical protein [Streptomyces sp. NPDC058045]|uniref:hypothetical protein n=1 Tax=Streptomyces sp. NPDC058045 TaxID=3346311 RepID=UPI0036EB821D